MTLSAAAQQLSLGAEISLYRINATSVGASIYYFVQASKTDGSPISFGGQAYTPVDIQVEDFQSVAGGTLPTPKMSISNTDGFVQALINQYGDLAGCEVRRIRTFAQFIDGAAQADSNSYIGPDVFRIERKTDENPDTIEWELSTAIDQEDKMLPGRVFLRDVCTRRYRSFQPGNPQAAPDGYVYPKIFPCPYTGSAAFGADGLPTTAAGDRCGRKDSDCRLRFGENGVLPTSAFPGIARVSQ